MRNFSVGSQVWVVCSSNNASVSIRGTITAIEEGDFEDGEFGYVIDDVLLVWEPSFLHSTRKGAEEFLVKRLSYRCNLFGLGHKDQNYLPNPEEPNQSLENFFSEFYIVSAGKNVSVWPKTTLENIQNFCKKPRKYAWFNVHDLKGDETVLEWLDRKNGIDTTSRSVSICLNVSYPRWVELSRRASESGYDELEQWIQENL